MSREKKVFAICDLDERYVIRLSSHLKEKKATPFEILAFTNSESLLSYAKDHSIEILLISEQAMTDQVKDLSIAKVMILSGEEDTSFPDHLADLNNPPDSEDGPEGASSSRDLPSYPSISKYQSSAHLAREVMQYYSSGRGTSTKTLKEAGADVYAVYSPISRCGKTLFSITLAELLARREKTLYLNLETYSGFEALFGETYRSDLADLVYLYRKNDKSLPFKIEDLIHTMRRADYLPPAFFPSDLREVGTEEWTSFLASVASSMNYRHLVLDIGDQPSDILALLRLADHIYLPLLPDPLSRAKVSQYEQNMEALAQGDLINRAIRLYLPSIAPQSGPHFLDSLLAGPMELYVGKLLAEQKRQAED